MYLTVCLLFRFKGLLAKAVWTTYLVNINMLKDEIWNQQGGIAFYVAFDSV